MTRPNPADTTVTLEDMRLAGHCVIGIRDWFNLYHTKISGFPDFRTFMLTREINGAFFLSTDDGYAYQIYDRKMDREFP